MAFDIFSTGRLIMAVQGIDPADSFLRDRYFPTGPADVFSTEQVLVQFRDGDRRLAPFVTRWQNGAVVERPVMEMSAYTPPEVKPKRPITLDSISKLGFGEAILGEYTPEQRAQVMVMNDLNDLDRMITRTEEKLCADTMVNNGFTVEVMGDDATTKVEDEVKYYSEASNPSAYTVTTKWDASGAAILDDLEAMADMLTQEGLPATDFVCAPDVAKAIVSDETVQKELDIRRYELGEIAPAITAPGAAVVGQLNVLGNVISIIAYGQKYRDEATGKLVPYVPAGTGIMTAPGAGRMLYGAVSQVEQEDGEFHTYPLRRVPKYVANADDDVRTLTLASRPLPCPNAKNPWVSASALLTA